MRESAGQDHDVGATETRILVPQELGVLPEHVFVRVEQTDTPFTNACRKGQILRIPIAHGEGNYYAPADTLHELQESGRIVFRYANAFGEATAQANPNGALDNIAGICNEARNVVGLMPHPERACQTMVGSADGRVVLESVVRHLAHTGTAGVTR